MLAPPSLLGHVASVTVAAPGDAPGAGHPDPLNDPTLHLAEAGLEQLRAFMRSLGSVLVCYSGGIDSALVLAVAHEQLGERAVGMTAVSPSLAPIERDAACAVAKAIGARHELVDSHELERAGYVANGPDRCFHCKTELYEIAQRKRDEWGLIEIANGTNADDLGDYRPGLEAAKQARVSSPLLQLGFGKERVRQLAQLMNLSIWAKPASACLSSRIPYGTPVSVERLSQIASFEAVLRDLGVRQVRVRWHDSIARIEVAASELLLLCSDPLRQRVIEAGREVGFRYVTVDLEGYRVGSHNEVLPGRSLPVIG
jgi:uncharacterized protein